MLTEEQMAQMKKDALVGSELYKENEIVRNMAQNLSLSLATTEFPDLPVKMVAYGVVMFMAGYIAREENWADWDWR